MKTTSMAVDVNLKPFDSVVDILWQQFLIFLRHLLDFIRETLLENHCVCEILGLRQAFDQDAVFPVQEG